MNRQLMIDPRQAAWPNRGPARMRSPCQIVITVPSSPRRISFLYFALVRSLTLAGGGGRIITLAVIARSSRDGGNTDLPIAFRETDLLSRCTNGSLLHFTLAQCSCVAWPS